MKRIVSVILVLAALLLTACQPASPEPTDDSTPTQSETHQTETQDPTTEPSQDPTEETQENWEPLDLFGAEDPGALAKQITEYQYQWGLDEYTVFVNVEGYYDDALLEKIDVTKLIPGALYVYQETEDQCFLITDQPIKQCNRGIVFQYVISTVKHYLYYVLEDEPNRVYRSDYTGTEQVLLYESPCEEITDLDYVGVNPNGKLLICEGNRYVVFFDIPTGQREVLVEDDSIDRCMFEYNYYTWDAPQQTFCVLWWKTGRDAHWCKDLKTGESRQVYFDDYDGE